MQGSVQRTERRRIVHDSGFVDQIVNGWELFRLHESKAVRVLDSNLSIFKLI